MQHRARAGGSEVAHEDSAGGRLRPLPESFYEQDTVTVARALLGAYLVHDAARGRTAGRIVETEAYLGANDPASHAFSGETQRNQVMFGAPGHAYIYFTYGMYHCVNVATMPAGTGEAVLLRALEPADGIALMFERRRVNRLERLCDGPAKLVLAMGITPALSGHDFRRPPLRLLAREGEDRPAIVEGPRIGISKASELPLRFHIAGSRFVSGRSRFQRK